MAEVKPGGEEGFEVDGLNLRMDRDGVDAFDVSVELDDKQKRALMVDGEKKEPWQILYMALDKLLFGHA